MCHWVGTRLMGLFSAGSVFLVLACGCQQADDQNAPDGEPVKEQETVMTSESRGLDATGATEASAGATSGDGSGDLAQVLRQVTDGSAVLVDVRSDEEWNASHFSQARHISIDRIQEDAAAACAELDKEQTVYLH